MKIQRTENTARNLVYGGAQKIVQIVIPFIIRTIMIYAMGGAYPGLTSLFASILQVLNLAELGVGSAMVYSMYRPIIEDDTAAICGLMALYRKYYRRIGLVILLGGLLLTPFVPILVKTDTVPSDVNVYVIYILNLSAAVLSYWLFAYKTALLSAHQRNDMISKAALLTSGMMYGVQIVIILVWKNYYAYLVTMLVFGIFSNLLMAKMADSLYPEYRAGGALERTAVAEINQRVKALFTSKIGSVVVNSADTIVISAFLGLTVLTMFQNYMLLIRAIIDLIAVLFTASMAGIGNSILVESKEKNYQDLQKLTFVIAWVAGICSSCFLCVFQPFIKLWVGDQYLLDFPVVVCLCIYFFLFEINQLLNTYKDASGIWQKDRYRPLVTAGVNLALNLLLVRTMGLYGVILCTIISMLLVGMPWLLHNLFHSIFGRKNLGNYIVHLLIYCGCAAGNALICYFCCSFVPVEGLLGILIRIIVCGFLSNSIFLALSWNREELGQVLAFANKLTGGRLRKENK